MLFPATIQPDGTVQLIVGPDHPRYVEIVAAVAKAKQQACAEKNDVGLSLWSEGKHPRDHGKFVSKADKKPASAPKHAKEPEGTGVSSEDYKALAEFYASHWNDAGITPDKLDDDEVDTVGAELEPGEWVLAWDDDENKWIVGKEDSPDDEPVQMSVHRAPKGYTRSNPLMIGGKSYVGGSFIPSKDYENATPEQKAQIDAGKQARTDARRGRGSVDHGKLGELLKPHAEHQLDKAALSSTKRAFNALMRHHGDLVVHRLEELAQDLHKAYSALPEDEEGKRAQFAQRLRGIGHMLEMAKAAGHTGEVAPKAAESEGVKGKWHGVDLKDIPDTAERWKEFERRSGHKVLTTSALWKDLAALGVSAYQAPKLRSGTPGKQGVKVSEVPGKKTVLTVAMMSNGDAGFDHAAEANKLEKELKGQGYSVARNPNGDPNILWVRKPLQANEGEPQTEDTKVDGKEPWEMTGREWSDASDKFRPNDSGGGVGHVGPQVDARIKSRLMTQLERGDKLRMGLNPLDDDGMPRSVTHRDVIEHALAAGKPVPPEVLADYPDLQPKPPASTEAKQPTAEQAKGAETPAGASGEAPAPSPSDFGSRFASANDLGKHDLIAEALQGKHGDDVKAKVGAALDDTASHGGKLGAKHARVAKEFAGEGEEVAPDGDIGETWSQEKARKLKEYELAKAAHKEKDDLFRREHSQQYADKIAAELKAMGHDRLAKKLEVNHLLGGVSLGGKPTGEQKAAFKAAQDKVIASGHHDEVKKKYKEQIESTRPQHPVKEAFDWKTNHARTLPAPGTPERARLDADTSSEAKSDQRMARLEDMNHAPGASEGDKALAYYASQGGKVSQSIENAAAAAAHKRLRESSPGGIYISPEMVKDYLSDPTQDAKKVFAKHASDQLKQKAASTLRTLNAEDVFMDPQADENDQATADKGEGLRASMKAKLDAAQTPEQIAEVHAEIEQHNAKAKENRSARWDRQGKQADDAKAKAVAEAGKAAEGIIGEQEKRHADFAAKINGMNIPKSTKEALLDTLDGWKEDIAELKTGKDSYGDPVAGDDLKRDAERIKSNLDAFGKKVQAAGESHAKIMAHAGRGDSLGWKPEKLQLTLANNKKEHVDTQRHGPLAIAPDGTLYHAGKGLKIASTGSVEGAKALASILSDEGVLPAIANFDTASSGEKSKVQRIVSEFNKGNVPTAPPQSPAPATPPAAEQTREAGSHQSAYKAAKEKMAKPGQMVGGVRMKQDVIRAAAKAWGVDEAEAEIRLEGGKEADAPQATPAPVAVPEAKATSVATDTPKAATGPHTMTEDAYVAKQSAEGMKKATLGQRNDPKHKEAIQAKASKDWKDAIERAYINGDAATDKPKWAKRETDIHPAGLGPMSDRHKQDIKDALVAGKPVPPEVLADYPDLAAKQQGGGPATQPAAPAKPAATPTPAPAKPVAPSRTPEHAAALKAIADNADHIDATRDTGVPVTEAARSMAEATGTTFQDATAAIQRLADAGKLKISGDGNVKAATETPAAQPASQPSTVATGPAVPTVSGKAGGAASRPFNGGGSVGDAVRSQMESLVDFTAYEDGIMPLRAIYQRLKQQDPSMSVEGFHSVLQDMWKHGDLQLKIQNEVKQLSPQDVPIVQKDHSGVSYYNYAVLPKRVHDTLLGKPAK